MTPAPSTASREVLDELGAELRDRMMALDEPVARDDWSDVVRRSRVSAPRMRRRSTIIVVTVAAAGVVAALAGLQLGVGVGVEDGESTQSVTTVKSAGVRSPRPGPLSVSWNGARLVGAVSSNSVDSVTVRFSDGTSARPRISWIAVPLAAGVFSYDVPKGKTVVAVSGDGEGQAIRQVTWYSV